ncbi:LOW QUALITY PROTEIN: major facilitator superfamily domain-containing protein [Colletotrichum cereale]|nr:LOW QUALITY PROTEIN: major facilitator superfamily domain-containing protein [Colletotrichum cereale]
MAVISSSSLIKVKGGEKGIQTTKYILPGPTADSSVWTNELPDPNVVDWDGPDDPANPLNWYLFLRGGEPPELRWLTFILARLLSKRWTNIMLISIITFNILLASTMFAPSLLDEFNTHSDLLATFVVSVYVLGLAIGPLVLPLMSELYGRVIIYYVRNVLFVVFTAAYMLIGFCFLVGLISAGALTISGGSIADLTTRGRAMNIWSIFWVVAILSGAITIISLVFLCETNAVRETGNMQLRLKLDSGVALRELFLWAILRPSKFLLLSPVCLLLSVYIAFNYAVLYFMFSTFSFGGSYRFTLGTVGLVYILLGIGMLFGIVVLQATGNRIMKKLFGKEPDGKSRPKHRIPIMMLGGILILIGLFIYGWTAYTNLYLVDSFTIYAALALGALAVLRSICGATFLLFLFDKLGLGWGNSLLAFIALAMWPVLLVFMKYGEYLQTALRFQVKL